MTSSTISSSSRTNTRFSSTTEPVASEVPQGYGYPPLSSVISSARIPNPSSPASSSETSTRSSSLSETRASEYEAGYVMPRVLRTATSSDRSSSSGSGYSPTGYQTSVSDYSEDDAAYLEHPLAPNNLPSNRSQNNQKVPGVTYGPSSHSPRPTLSRLSKDRQQEQYTGDEGLYNGVHKWRTDISEHPGGTSPNDEHAYSERNQRRSRKSHNASVEQSRRHLEEPQEDVYGCPPREALMRESSRPASSRRQLRHTAPFGHIDNHIVNARQRSSQPLGYRSYSRSSHLRGTLDSYRSRRSSGSNSSFWQKFENSVRFWSGLDPYWGIHRGDSQYSVSNRVRSPPGRYARTRASTPSMRDRSRENAQIVSQDHLQIPHGGAKRPRRQASTLPSIRIAYGDPPSSDLNPRPSRHASPRPTVWPGRESHWSSLRSQSHLEMQAPSHRHMYAPPASSGPLRSKPTTASGHLHNNSSHRSEHTGQKELYAYVSRRNTAPITVCEPCFKANKARAIDIRIIGEPLAEVSAASPHVLTGALTN